MNNDFGDRLSFILSEKQISQREFAEKIGVSDVSISRYMHGTRSPRMNILRKMAEVLGVSASELIGEVGEMDEYILLKTLIKRNASMMTKKQKIDVVNLLFESEG